MNTPITTTLKQKSVRILLAVLLVIFLLNATHCKKQSESLFEVVPSSNSGIDFNNKIVETDSFNILTSEYIFNGGGVAIGDFNNDQKPDIFFSGNQVSNKLYLNEGNFKFKDISKESGIEALNKWNTGVALADINNDGFLDIYVCSAMLNSEQEKKNILFIHQGLDDNGIPSFKNMGKEYGLEESGNSMGASFLDYNKDGLLDLYVLNNVDVHILPSNFRKKITDGSALSNDKLYKNNGDGTFSDVTIEAGITIEGYGLGLSIADLNYDGWPDIYVSNDYLSNDILYVNNQDGTFSNKIKENIKHQSKFSMGNDISDYNNDGYLDIITLDMLGETNERLKTTLAGNKYTEYILNDRFGYEYQHTRNMLQKGNGNNVPFSEIGLMAGVSKTDWSWSPLFADMDNDGYEDLLITNGFPRDITDLDFGDFKFNVSRYLSPAQILDSIPKIKIPNYAYKNNTNNQFTDVSEDWGIGIASFSNGAAFADLDNDGDLDYIVNNINDEALIFQNKTDLKDGQHNYLSVDLKDSPSKSQKTGAKIVLRFDDNTFQYKEHHTYRGYMSTVEDIMHFGLGNIKQITSIEILWPDYKFQKISNVKANQRIILDYEDAISIAQEKLSFPFVPKKENTIFKEVSSDLGLSYIHEEKDFIDYNIQRTIPHKLTQNGPITAVGDMNGDGFEDFIIGSSSGKSPQIFFQNSTGKFTQQNLFDDEENKTYEEESIALFDLENDGDLDMYLVSGSNEFNQGSTNYNHRLLVNDGQGNFEVATNKMPTINTSGSIVTVSDFNKDGFVDLFVGGRTPYSQYPNTEKSFLLKNHNGVLEDVTKSMAPDLGNVGMVTDAVWADIDLDGYDDLIVIGEFMPISIFKNNGANFKKLDKTGIEKLSGWWESIAQTDIDNDGDIDFVVGNLGMNNFYQPSEERPVTVVAKDFDDNGTIDPVMFAYFKDSFDKPTYKAFPVNFWGDLNGQSPIFRAKFNTFKAYSKATISTLFTDDELEGSTKLIGNFDNSIIIENNGDSTFKYSPLPIEAQVAPINGITFLDYNNDGYKDLLLVGNNFGNEVFIGRNDAFNGLLLENDGKGKFKSIETSKSGFLVPGDSKSIVKVNSDIKEKPYYIVTQNRDSIKVFQKN
ncbi:VCBS repeat-containing protein [Maribacter sp. SA7]|uniref:VCBS repeat-containing protein n=1 Tax=Maribacter zhoushanensis TaxID=3030012 RepID=UPI0023EA8238|nr:VCBS repeat-containing protein [Maribacter zhoushanensis]MDF4204170.1 VCBS repeat-containing protein [Maribacter zhoushanensis]